MNKLEIQSRIEILEHIKLMRAKEKERLSDVSMSADIESFNKQIDDLKKQLLTAETK